jgi:uncharacterized protein
MRSAIITKKVSITIEGRGETSGIINLPEGSKSNTALIVAHGAGNNMNTPLLSAFSEGLANAGYPVMRFNFLYSEHGKKTPDRPEILVKTWLSAYSFFKETMGNDINFIIGAGKSMGGRIASQMVADNILPVNGLIFLGYPLHPAQNTQKLRDSHLYRIMVPMLFFAGTRDPLCNLDTLNTVLKKIEAPWDLNIIEGGDHSFHVPKSMEETDRKIYEKIIKKTIDWFSR